MKLNVVIFASHFCQWPTPAFDNRPSLFYTFSISGQNITVLAYGEPGSRKTHLIGTAYNGDNVTGVTSWAINDIFFHSQRNGELGFENNGFIFGGKLNPNFVNFIYNYLV